MSSIVPTIGRKVWYWSSGHVGVLDNKQAFDATVIYVVPSADPSLVHLQVINHMGYASVENGVALRDHQEGDSHSSVEYRVATWMPYQMGQAQRTEAAEAARAKTKTPTPPKGTP